MSDTTANRRQRVQSAETGMSVLKALARLGATKAEVHETLGVAVYMGGGPSAMYAANAVAAFDEFMAETPPSSLPAEQ